MAKKKCYKDFIPIEEYQSRKMVQKMGGYKWKYEIKKKEDAENFAYVYLYERYEELHIDELFPVINGHLCDAGGEKIDDIVKYIYKRRGQFSKLSKFMKYTVENR